MTGLRDAYQVSVSNEDNDKCLNYCRVFTELAETMLTKIVDHTATTSTGDTPHFAMPIFDAVLMSCSHPDYDISFITFPMW